MFHSKVVSSDWDEHSRLLEDTNTLAYYGVRTLQIRNVFYSTGACRSSFSTQKLSQYLVELFKLNS
jgi:hypothetical protein